MKIKSIAFYLKKLWRDQTNPLIYSLPECGFGGQKLDFYYFKFEEKSLLAGGSQDFHFDNEGIPLIPTYIDVNERKLHYYPTSIGQYALAIFHSWLETRDDAHLARFRKIVDWFSNNQDGKGRWLASVPNPTSGLYPGWPSAMAQGRGLNILLRGWQVFGVDKYREQAEKALGCYQVPVKDGGVLSSWNGGPFFEEFPSENAAHELNGMIFAMWGLWDYIRSCPNPKMALDLWNMGVDTLCSALPDYDLGYWSAYDLLHKEGRRQFPNVATMHYHWIHIRQLEVMERITSRKEFSITAKRWRSYAQSRLNSLRASIGKGLRVLTR